jgi:hypothetical protein
MPSLPIPEHFSSGLLSVIKESYRLVYLRGVYDGFVAGALAVLILLPRSQACRNHTDNQVQK